MTLVSAIDASFDTLTRGEARCLRDRGVALFVQCLWTASVAPISRVESLRNATDENMRIAGYISLNRYSEGVWHVDRGRDGIPDDLWDTMEFVAVDVELDGVHIDEIVAAVNRVKELGQRPILYTNYNSWTTKVVPRNPDTIAKMEVPLWNAYWDGNPDIDFTSLRFGGWRDDQVMVEQWEGDVSVCGTFVDWNSVVLEFLNEGNGGEEDMGMTSDELRKMEELRLEVADAGKDAVEGRDRSAWNLAVLKVFQTRVAFNDELTRRLWKEVFPSEVMPEDEGGTLEEQVTELNRKLRAMRDALKDPS